MKYFVFLGISIILTAIAVAQETTYGGRALEKSERGTSFGSMVVIPFENRMYLSDVDAPIGRETGLQPGELQTKFRNALVETLESELQKDWDVVRMHDPSTMSPNDAFEYVHNSLKYDYIDVSDEVIMANDTTIDKKQLKKQSKSSKEPEGIVNGQVVSRSDNRPKYMNMRIENDELMPFLDSTVQSDYYLFINEFDIRYFVTNPDQISRGGLSYQLKVHFSCIDQKGKSLVSGMSTKEVSAGTQNLYEIIAAGIPDLSAKTAKMIKKFKVDQ